MYLLPHVSLAKTSLMNEKKKNMQAWTSIKNNCFIFNASGAFCSLLVEILLLYPALVLALGKL